MSIPHIQFYPEQALQVVPSQRTILDTVACVELEDTHPTHKRKLDISTLTFAEGNLSPPSSKLRRTDSGYLDANSWYLESSTGRQAAVSPVSTVGSSTNFDADVDCFDFLCEGMQVAPTSSSRAAAEKLGLKDSTRLLDGTEIVLCVVHQPEEVSHFVAPNERMPVNIFLSFNSTTVLAMDPKECGRRSRHATRTTTRPCKCRYGFFSSPAMSVCVCTLRTYAFDKLSPRAYTIERRVCVSNIM